MTMTKQQILERIEEVEAELASAKAHFTDYDEAGQDIEDCEAELKNLRAAAAEVEHALAQWGRVET